MASESLLSCISLFLRNLRNKWQISLRGHLRSSILVPIESAYTYSYFWSLATWSLSCTVSAIRQLKCQKSAFFAIPLLFRLKFGGVLLGVDPSCWGEKVRLISREIIFQEFQPIWSRYLNVADRRTTCLGNTALRVASRGKNSVPVYRY